MYMSHKGWRESLHQNIMATLERDSETVKSVLLMPFTRVTVFSFERVSGALVGSHSDIADEDEARVIANLELISDEWHSDTLTLN